MRFLTGNKIRNFFKVPVFPRVMKTPITTLLLTSLLVTASLRAQNEVPPPSPVQQASCKQRHGHHHLLSALSDGEKSQLKTAMRKIKGDPQLVAARQSLEEAQTKEAKAAAHESLRNIRRDLLLKADPSLASVLDKIKAAKHAKTPVS